MRKLLWISSKTTSNLGPKPQTFIARAISCDKRKRYPAHQLLENTVIDLRDYLTISAFDKDSFVKLRRFVLFNHRAVNIGFTKIETKYIGQIFSPRITFVRIHGSQIDFPTLVKTVPYATYFSFISDLPKGWEKVLLNFKSKSMGPFFLTPKEITDFDSLHKFLTRQIPKFFLYLTDERNKFRTRKFYRYFQRELISGPKLRIDYKTKNGKDVSVKYSPKILT
uniref:Ribosomal protein L5 n=1 Tax=Panagrolaimus sp. JU765 TaxID=591449 RepID=A0AC34QGY2_9BILA